MVTTRSSASRMKAISSEDKVSSKTNGLVIEKEEDPYADVRDQMEALAARDRARFVFHQDDDSYEGGEPSVSAFAAQTTYLGYAIIIGCGHIRNLLSRFFQRGRYVRRNTPNFASDNRAKYAALLKTWETFYTRRMYHRIQDCFNRPIASRPGDHIHMLERVSADGNKTMDLLGPLSEFEGSLKQKQVYQNSKHITTVSEGRVARTCLNLGSYNYLGFADDWDVTCQKDVLGSLNDLPVSAASCRSEFGTTSLHRQVEDIVAKFVGKEDALVLNMGFNTNATTIPALVDRGDLIISDQLNHTSIVNGARASGAAIRTFRHNDTQHLETVLREAIIMGQPRTRRPWKKILVLVEGVYSMEGEYCDLRNIVRVAKKYGAYTYLDEAHSIGALGATGRGCAEYTGVDPADIDIMMGTFTKSFGGMGGYIAGDLNVISYLRQKCAGSSLHNSLSPVVCQQIITSFKVIMGEDGTDIGKKKLRALRDNSNYFRMRLTEMGLHLLGHYDSPIIPLMMYSPPMIAAFSRECLKRGLAVVVVGFPAVPVLACRARFCVSAGHTREDLDFALEQISEIADILKIRYGRSMFG